MDKKLEMKKNNIIAFSVILLVFISIIGLIWQLLEVEYCDGVRHRTIDDYIMIIGIIVPIIAYIIGRKHKEKEMSVQNGEQKKENRKKRRAGVK